MNNKKGFGKVLVGLVLALVLLGLGVAMYMQFSGDATRGVTSLMSCSDGVATGPLLAITGGEAAYCFTNVRCETALVEEDEECPQGWSEEGNNCVPPQDSEWQSAGRVGCPDNNFCCVEVKNEGTTNNEEENEEETNNEPESTTNYQGIIPEGEGIHPSP